MSRQSELAVFEVSLLRLNPLFTEVLATSWRLWDTLTINRLVNAMRISAAIIAGMILGSDGSVSHSDEKADLADRIHSYVIENFPEYRAIRRTKVMVACIEWGKPYIHNVFVTYTDPGSDRPIFIAKLQQNAMLRCRRWASLENIECTCQILDKNGKNALRVP